MTTTSAVTSSGAGPRSRDEPSGPGDVTSQLHVSADDSRLQLAPDEGRVPSRNPRLPSDGALSAPGALSFLNRGGGYAEFVRDREDLNVHFDGKGYVSRRARRAALAWSAFPRSSRCPRSNISASRQEYCRGFWLHTPQTIASLALGATTKPIGTNLRWVCKRQPGAGSARGPCPRIGSPRLLALKGAFAVVDVAAAASLRSAWRRVSSLRCGRRRSCRGLIASQVRAP